MKHTLCDYCHGIGACPSCWGRNAIDLLRAQNKELLEALKALISCDLYRNLVGGFQAQIEQAETAISKAEGKR